MKICKQLDNLNNYTLSITDLNEFFIYVQFLLIIINFLSI